MAAAQEFWSSFWSLFPAIAPRLVLAWLVTTLSLCLAFRGMKAYVRDHLKAVDIEVRDWALDLRFRDQKDISSDRVWRTWFMRFWTNFASAPSLCVVSVLLAIWAHANQTRPTLFYLPGLCFLASMGISFISKRVFKRPRPHREIGSFGHKMKDASFPSGHSLTAFCFWFTLVVTLYLSGAGPVLMGIAALAAIVIVVCTGISRIYLGVHFPSDVLGGYTLGIVWCFVCFFALRGTL